MDTPFELTPDELEAFIDFYEAPHIDPLDYFVRHPYAAHFERMVDLGLVDIRSSETVDGAIEVSSTERGLKFYNDWNSYWGDIVMLD